MLTTNQITSDDSKDSPDKAKGSPTQKSQHKLEGKNKKSLHQKQQQQQQQPSLTKDHCPSPSSRIVQTNNRRQHHLKSLNVSGKTSTSSSNSTTNSKSSSPQDENPNGNNQVNCISLDEFSKRAAEIKAEINEALEKQIDHKIIDQPVEVVQLKEDILKLSGNLNPASETSIEQTSLEDRDLQEAATNSIQGSDTKVASNEEHKKPNCESTNCSNQKNKDRHEISSSQQESSETTELKETFVYESDTVFEKALFNLNDKINEEKPQPPNKTARSVNKKKSNNNKDTSEADKLQASSNKISDDLEPLLSAKLDTNSKVLALMTSLKKSLSLEQIPDGQALEVVCRKLVDISDKNSQLNSDNILYRVENQKLSLIKQKLENLCRELQKSNNAIRIESLDLIKVEQGKAKEQTSKIQSTLTGVIKLFDENQQRNMTLRQENQDLQTKLKSLLDHCDNWEKSVEVALRQRDIENRLIKTELVKANLLKNEEKEKFLGEKQELLQILSMMQEQQHRIEGQEAKLRSDLSSYASKYDECQAVISKGMNKFQSESKKMLKQIEKSKQDYKALLSKYESSNKKMAQLLEEKQFWDKAMNMANKKIATLEKLCRALKDQKMNTKSNEALTNHNNNNNHSSNMSHNHNSSNSSKNKSKAKVNNSKNTNKQSMGPSINHELVIALDKVGHNDIAIGKAIDDHSHDIRNKTKHEHKSIDTEVNNDLKNPSRENLATISSSYQSQQCDINDNIRNNNNNEDDNINNDKKNILNAKLIDNRIEKYVEEQKSPELTSASGKN